MEYKVKRFDKRENVDFDKVEKAPIDSYKWADNGIRYEAFGKLCFAEDFGFVCKMACREADPWVQYHNDGEAVYLDSALEFFGRFTDEGYINCENNADGVRLQQFGTDRFDRVPVWGVMPDGFHVKADRDGEWWSVTVELPIEKMQVYYKDITHDTFKSGYTFTGNFYKTGHNPETEEDHFGMWHEIDSEVADFHLPDKFGTFVME